MDNKIFRRLARLEQRPGSRIPSFSVELADGSTATAHGFGLLALDGVKRISYDHRQPCADTVLDLFQMLNPAVEVV